MYPECDELINVFTLFDPRFSSENRWGMNTTTTSDTGKKCNL